MAGTPTTDEDKDFQDKLRARAEADRKKQNAPVQARQQQQQQQQQPQSPAAAGAAGALPAAVLSAAADPTTFRRAGPTREVRLKNAKSRRTRAIVLMAIGVPMSLAGIGVLAWAVAPSVPLSFGEEWGYGFLGSTFGVVGVTLWAPGAASFVKSSHDIKELSKPEPTPQPMPPTARGF